MEKYFLWSITNCTTTTRVRVLRDSAGGRVVRVVRVCVLVSAAVSAARVAPHTQPQLHCRTLSAAHTAAAPLQCAVSGGTCAPLEVKRREQEREGGRGGPVSLGTSHHSILGQKLCLRRWKDESERLSGENRGERGGGGGSPLLPGYLRL